MLPSSENRAGTLVPAHTCTEPAGVAEQQQIVSRRRRRRQQCRSNTLCPPAASPTVTRLWMLLCSLLLARQTTDHGGCFVAIAWRTASMASKNKITRTASASTVMLLYLKDTGNKESSGSTNSTKLFYQNAADDEIAKDSLNQFLNTTSTNNNIINNNNNETIPSFASGGGGGTLGDIMSSLHRNDDDDDDNDDDADEGMLLLLRDGLVTKESQSLARAYHIHNPLDRMAVTANGNLQRLFSSYYDAPVMVVVEYCNRRKALEEQRQQANDDETSSSPRAAAAAAIWDRRVLLQLSGDFDNDQPQTLCTADSTVVVHNQEVEELIESGTVGIGQLFRHFNVLPEFTLLAAGPSNKHGGGGFWRNYTLTSDKLVTCYIHEEFCEDVWNLRKPSDKEE